MSSLWTIDNFMNKHFNNLPFDLQIKIIKRATKPVPKFKYGDAVEFVNHINNKFGQIIIIIYCIQKCLLIVY